MKKRLSKRRSLLRDECPQSFSEGAKLAEYQVCGHCVNDIRGSLMKDIRDYGEQIRRESLGEV